MLILVSSENQIRQCIENSEDAGAWMLINHLLLLFFDVVYTASRNLLCESSSLVECP